MFANALSFFWSVPLASDTTLKPLVKRHPPIFIGDAVQPFAGETLLLTLLREAALRDLDQSDE